MSGLDAGVRTRPYLRLRDGILPSPYHISRMQQRHHPFIAMHQVSHPSNKYHGIHLNYRQP